MQTHAPTCIACSYQSSTNATLSYGLHSSSECFGKFYLIVISLDEDVILDIEDLVAAPPQQDRYESLKARLLKKYAQTTEKKIQRLLQAKEMTGMKPTEMLAHMRRLAPSSLEPVIRSIFLQNIPSSIRPLLSAWPEDDLDNLAEVADKMLDAAKMDDVHISQQSMQLPAGSSLDLGLRRSFCWSFIVADVPIAIIGADFLAKHNLLIDLKAQQLIDTATKVSVTGSSCKVETPSVSTINEDQNYHTLLRQGQDTSKSDDHGTTRVPHDVVHHIETTGNPVADRPQMDGKEVAVSTERLKPAFILNESGDDTPANNNKPLRTYERKKQTISLPTRSLEGGSCGNTGRHQ
ncbi:hypothetical protein ACLKA6_018646 [Drosophila palustris]